MRIFARTCFGVWVAEQSEFLLDWNTAQFSSLRAGCGSWYYLPPNPTLSYEASQGHCKSRRPSPKRGVFAAGHVHRNLVLADHGATLLLAPDFAKGGLCLASKRRAGNARGFCNRPCSPPALSIWEKSCFPSSASTSRRAWRCRVVRVNCSLDLDHSGSVVVTVTWFLDL